MTYRSMEGMRGMGEWSAVLGATCPSLPTGGCLDATMLGLVAAAKFGLPGPAGMTPDTWAKMVAIVKNCQSPSWQLAPACYSVTTQLFTSTSKGGLMPDCLDANAIAFMTYAGRYPGANGPDPVMNSLVWVAQKGKYLGQTYLAALRKKPLCSAGTAPPGAPDTSAATADAAAHAAAATAAAQTAAAAASAGAPAAADAAAADAATHAQAAADAASAAGTPDAASHADDAAGAANAAASAAGGAPVHHAGMTTGKWVAVGAVGLAAVVGVAMLMKKR